MAESIQVHDVEARQRMLGDPCGMGNSEYWDEWFRVVSRGKRFEWYCDSDAVAAVLSAAVCGGGGDDGGGGGRAMSSLCLLHLGSGNSGLPVDLAAPPYGVLRSSVVDISVVAVGEMKEGQIPPEWIVEDATTSLLVTADVVVPRISLHVADVLDPPLEFAGDSVFDAVVDKGLFDALMDDDDGQHPSSSLSTPSVEKTRTLFGESARVLADGGCYVCISLGERHIVKLIVDAAFADDGGGGASPWGNTLRIYEVLPLPSDSSGMRPFAFVVTKERVSNDGGGLAVEFYREGDLKPATTVGPDVGEVVDILDESRCRFKERTKTSGSAAAFGGDDNDDDPPRMSLARIHVKPWDDGTDLTSLAVRIRGEGSRCCCGGEFSGDLTWTETETVPMGYGLSKLVLSCVVEDGRLEELCNLISEAEEEFVQSVDIDWEATVPVMGVPNVLKYAGKVPTRQ